jgi:hypothetical protein
MKAAAIFRSDFITDEQFMRAIFALLLTGLIIVSAASKPTKNPDNDFVLNDAANDSKDVVEIEARRLCRRLADRPDE